MLGHSAGPPPTYLPISQCSALSAVAGVWALNYAWSDRYGRDSGPEGTEVANYLNY